MPLSLQHFEEQIDPVILQRGERLWQNAAVKELEALSDGSLTAIVSGTQDYYVNILSKDDEVTRFDCTCPYDHGPVCKHVVAVLLEFKIPYDEQMAASSKAKSKTTKPKRKNKPQFKQVLKQTSDAELRAFVEAYASKDSAFKNAILSRFMTVDAGAADQSYATLVRSILRAAQDRYKFIDYRKSMRVGQELGELSQKAAKLVEMGQPEAALPLVKALLKETTMALAHADDSSGMMGGVIDHCFDSLEIIVDELQDTESRKSLLEYCLESSKEGCFISWGWERNFLWMAVTLVVSKDEIAGLKARLQKYGKKEYSYNEVMEIRLELIRKAEGEKAAQIFLEKHLDIDEFRAAAISRARENNEFDKAQQLALGGIEKGKGFIGSKEKWMVILLELATERADQKEIRKYAQELFLDMRSSFNYYDILKEQYPSSEWPEKVDMLIAEIRKERWHDRNRISEILKRENRLSELMDHLEVSSPTEATIDQFQAFLMPEYSERVLKLYESYVWHSLEQTGGRKSYKKTCKVMAKMKKLGGDEQVKHLAKEIAAKYKKRIALLEELENYFLL